MRTPTSTVSTAPAEEAEPNQEEATPTNTQQDMVTETFENENVLDEPVDADAFPKFNNEPMVK